MSDEAEPRRAGGGNRGVFAELAKTVILALVLAFLLKSFVGQGLWVDGPSMEPTLRDGQMIFVLKLAHYFGPPSQGQVIVVSYPRNPEKDLVKRVIATAGQTIEIRSGQVYVDGQPLDEPYVVFSDKRSYAPTTVPEGMVYILGDNRSNSDDSRAFGPVAVSGIKGRALAVIRPVMEFHVIR